LGAILRQIYRSIVNWAIDQSDVSASKIQRKFEIGYPRASRIVQRMVREGYLSKFDTKSGPLFIVRKVKYTEEKMGKCKPKLGYNTKAIIGEIEERHKRHGAIAKYIVPLCSRLSSEFKDSTQIQLGNPIYSFISACEKNYKTILISEFLNLNMGSYVLIEALSGISVENLLCGKISESEWPHLISSVASIYSWPGELVKLNGKSNTVKANKIMSLLKQDYEVYIFDFDTSSKSKILGSPKLHAKIFKFAERNNKKIILRT
jgi:hypothetical protein